MRFRFGGFLLDDESFRLTRAGQPVALRRKVFDLLVVLVQERERVVLREELVERLWSSTVVGAGSLSGLVNELRTALAKGGGDGSSIRTVHARGYQFVASVAIEPEQDVRGVAAAAAFAPESSPEPRVSRDRLEQARSEVLRFGARALVAGLVDAASRARWLAGMLSAAREARFEARFEVVGAEGFETRVGEPIVVGRLEPSAIAGSLRPGATGTREPIALGIEVHDPLAWDRAGGLGRLLDLLGRAPVIVIAGLAATAEDERLRSLFDHDARIEWAVPLGSDGGSDRQTANGPGLAAPSRPRLDEILRALARADRGAFEAAIRAMGFETARMVPIRAVRRAPPRTEAADVRNRA